MKIRKLVAFMLCMAVIVSVGASQVVTGVAEPQCTCVISVHGTNCPLSKCTCGLKHDENNTECPLTGQSAEMTTCICDPHIHAPGCPLYVEANGGADEGAANEAERYVLEYVLREGDVGELSFDKTSIVEGEMIGKECIPEVVPEEGWALSKFVINEEEYTHEELEKFIPQEDTKIEICLEMIVASPAAEPTPSQDAAVQPTPGEAEGTPDPAAQPTPSEAVETPAGETEEAASYTLTYTLREGDEGTVSFGEVHITAGEAIGTVGIPEVTPAEGWQFVSFAIGEAEYTAEELAQYVPASDTGIEVRLAAAAPTEGAGSYMLSYTLREGDEGTLSFNMVNIVSGEAVGVTGIPNVTAAEGWQLTAFAIGEAEYTAEALAEYIPESDTAIEVRLGKIIVTPYDDPEAVIEDDEGGDAEFWEYPPEWTSSGQKHIKGNLLAAVQIKFLSTELTDYMDSIMTALKVESEIYVRQDEDNTAAVLAVYAVLSGETENFPYGLQIEGDENITTLRSLYWSSTQVTGVSNTEGSALDIQRMDIDEIAEYFGLTDEQKQQAVELMESAPRAATLLSDSILSKLSDEEFEAVISSLPENISAERKAVLTAALSLKDKVDYIWGGKSTYVGWDDRWGEMRTVTSEGSKSYGTARPMGLDCSGFVSWAFINANGSKDVLQYIGSGTANQYKNSSSIEWNAVQPGDLVFTKTPTAEGTNHVGIVLSVNALGEPDQVIHCSSSQNGVVVTDSTMFKFARRPYIYDN